MQLIRHFSKSRCFKKNDFLFFPLQKISVLHRNKGN